MLFKAIVDDGRRTLANDNSSPWAYGSGELKISGYYPIHQNFLSGALMAAVVNKYINIYFIYKYDTEQDILMKVNEQNLKKYILPVL